MKLLLDECLPVRLRTLLHGHDVYTVQYMGWLGIRNSQLLSQAASADFDGLITIDEGFAHEQDIQRLPVAVVLIRSPSNAMDALRPLVPEILKVLDDLRSGALVRVG
jgi:predicted nuclease of predicted toxin-antitoxin system